jgi:osmotically-inducible protein OsmY
LRAHNLVRALAIVCCVVVAAGCENTAEGVKQDAARAKEKATAASEEAAKQTSDAADKAGDAVASGARDAASQAGRALGKAGKSISGAAQTIDIKAALMADRNLDASNIEVATDEAAKTIVLKGTVTAASDKAAAEVIAGARAPGYRIVNDIVVN